MESVFEMTIGDLTAILLELSNCILSLRNQDYI